jgi:hypothetical protein
MMIETLRLHLHHETKFPLYFLLLLWATRVSGFSVNDAPLLPMGSDALLRQASSAVRTAMDDGIHRQWIRLPLSESMYSEKEESFVADRAIGWQGGPQETFRFISPLAHQLLQDISYDDGTGLTPKVQEQILLDFDGSSLLNAISPLGPLLGNLHREFQGRFCNLERGVRRLASALQTAPTGCAASLANGSTLHRIFKYPRGKAFRKAPSDMASRNLKTMDAFMRQMNDLFLHASDEFSMKSHGGFAWQAHRLEEARNPNRFMGGLPFQVELGDVQQLPAVCAKSLYDDGPAKDPTSACAMGRVALEEFLQPTHPQDISTVVIMDEVTR